MRISIKYLGRARAVLLCYSSWGQRCVCKSMNQSDVVTLKAKPPFIAIWLYDWTTRKVIQTIMLRHEYRGRLLRVTTESRSFESVRLPSFPGYAEALASRITKLVPRHTPRLYTAPLPWERHPGIPVYAFLAALKPQGRWSFPAETWVEIVGYCSAAYGDSVTWMDVVSWIPTRCHRYRKDSRDRWISSFFARAGDCEDLSAAGLQCLYMFCESRFPVGTLAASLRREALAYRVKLIVTVLPLLDEVVEERLGSPDRVRVIQDEWSLDKRIRKGFVEHHAALAGFHETLPPVFLDPSDLIRMGDHHRKHGKWEMLRQTRNGPSDVIYKRFMSVFCSEEGASELINDEIGDGISLRAFLDGNFRRVSTEEVRPRDRPGALIASSTVPWLPPMHAVGSTEQHSLLPGVSVHGWLSMDEYNEALVDTWRDTHTVHVMKQCPGFHELTCYWVQCIAK